MSNQIVGDHIVRSYFTVEVDGQHEKHVLVIETDLPLSNMLPGFDAEKFATLVNDARLMMEANHCDSATIKSANRA
jgi:hypothetical protein